VGVVPFAVVVDAPFAGVVVAGGGGPGIGVVVDGTRCKSIRAVVAAAVVAAGDVVVGGVVVVAGCSCLPS